MMLAAVHMVWLPLTDIRTKMYWEVDVSVLFCTVEPLYDWSGRALTAHEQQMMRHYQITFRHLITIFEDFCSCSSTATESGNHSCWADMCALADEIFVFVVNVGYLSGWNQMLIHFWCCALMMP